MRSEIKIGIVEDELLIAEKIKLLLIELGYVVTEPVSNYEDALNMITNEKPDLLLLDINLSDKKDGIDIGQKVLNEYGIPFIFLTANSDATTIARAKMVKPYAYLVKPFTKDELFAAIEISFNNYSQRESITITSSPALKRNEFIFIRDNHKYFKVHFDSIAYIESMENYVVIHTRDKKTHTVRSTFNDFIKQLPESKFYRVHRSFVIQLDLIDHVEHGEVVVGGMKVALSATYRDGLYEVLGIK